MRLMPEAGEEVLRARIDSLASAHPIAREEFDRRENGYQTFVDQVTYIIQDSVDAGNGFPSVGVTINHIFVGRGVVFGDGGEIVSLNYDLVGQERDGNLKCKREERLMIHIEQSNEPIRSLPIGKFNIGCHRSP